MAAATIIAIAIGIACRSFVGKLITSPTTSEIQGILQPLVNADKVVLYSIEGNNFEQLSKNQTPGEDVFYGCPVLGKVEISGPARRKWIAENIERGIQATPPAMCFMPHHAIRAETDGQTVDYLICYKCSLIYIYSGGSLMTRPTTRSSEAALNEILRDAGIPIATK